MGNVGNPLNPLPLRKPLPGIPLMMKEVLNKGYLLPRDSLLYNILAEP